MSRAIKLTRLHAINWYGYNDSLPVAGNLLLAGVAGSGKSVIMDLVMAVLVGTEVAHNHFNRSATGGHSDRTLKGYCLLDTKREEGGMPQYQRDKGAITYIALEFTWPAKPDDETRVETWGLRIEFRNASENQGKVTPFLCPASLTRDDFLAVSPEDGKKRPLEIGAFRRFVEKEQGGRIFETQTPYLRDMANEEHLNFNPAVLAALLPQAMSFTNRKSFDSFIRDFVLPGDQLNVSNVIASYRDFLAYEKDLGELHDQLKRLQTIRDFDQAVMAAKRDQLVARWLAAELGHTHAAAAVREQEAKLVKEKAEFAKEEERIAKLDDLITDRQTAIEELKNLIRTTPGGEMYLFIKDRNNALVAEIEGLRAVGTRVDDALRNRVRKACQWLGEVKAAPVSQPIDTTGLEVAIARLEDCEGGQSETALKAVAAAAEQVSIGLNRLVDPDRKKRDELRPKLGKLNEEISALENGHLPFPTTLLEALNAALPWDGRQPPAQPLCKLCEVSDEKWRAAIEVAFTRKFAIVVSEASYESALRIYHGLKTDSPHESLVNPAKALRLARPVMPGSLAEKLQTDHPVVRAIVSQRFGDLMCVERPEDLARHDFAILPDGFMIRGAFVERRRRYDGMPFVGLRGLEQQLALKRSQWKELDAHERRLTPIVSGVLTIVERMAQFIPEHNSLTRDLVEAQRLPKLQKELADNLEKLGQIDTASFEEKEQALVRLGNDLPVWESERRKLLVSQKRGEILQITAALTKAENNLVAALKAFERVKTEVGDISIHASRLMEWRAEIASRFPILEVAAREFERAEGKAETLAATASVNLHAARRELALVYRPKFDELVVEDPSNSPWDRLWDKVKDANIPDYEQKSKIERARWEHLFRSNVLQKLDQALRRLRDVIVLLNGNLKTPIGNDLYEIDPKPNPEFKHLRDLVSLNAQHQRDELFYAAVEGEMRATLENFLRVLVEKPEGGDAVRLLDYRHYYDYTLLVRDIRDPLAKPINVDRQSGKMSGGENQSPYFVVILASYLRAYKRHETRWRDPSLALVPIDEAFSKMDNGQIKDCIEAIKDLDLQGVFSMSTGNVPGAFGHCDQLIIVSRNEDKQAGRAHIRNVPVSIFRDSEEGQEWMREHA